MYPSSSPRLPRRRWRLGLTVALLSAAFLPAIPIGAAHADATWQLRWAPEASQDGLGAFEGVEDDRANSHPAGQPHIFVENNNFRFNMHMVDRDFSTDRQLHVFEGDVIVGSTDLAPLQNRWIDMQLDMTIGDGRNGQLRWVIRNGSSTVIDVSRTGVDTWLDDRVRPKWGIYRSLGDTSGSLQDCYLLLTNMRAYQWSGTSAPPLASRLEAENATIFHGTVESDHLGFTGTGFVNYFNEVGSYVQWTVTASERVVATLTFRYANGTTTNRTMDIRVNGLLVADELAFNNTLSWDMWDTRTISVVLSAGSNTIRASATTADGGPNLDNLQVATSPLPPPTRYEAENATISQGTVATNHLGFSGTGFVDYTNVAGSYVQWTVNAPAAGPMAVTFRFANGTTTNRPMDITVNGTLVAGGLAFNGTGSWDTWATVTITAQLRTGTNTIRATATTANGGPSMDNLTV